MRNTDVHLDFETMRDGKQHQFYIHLYKSISLRQI